VSPVKYELGFYIPEDILHRHGRENHKSYKDEVCFCEKWITPTRLYGATYQHNNLYNQ
jgi:hypothetical protein